jgi:hypothetical protein
MNKQIEWNGYFSAENIRFETLKQTNMNHSNNKTFTPLVIYTLEDLKPHP